MSRVGTELRNESIASTQSTVILLEVEICLPGVNYAMNDISAARGIIIIITAIFVVHKIIISLNQIRGTDRQIWLNIPSI